MEILGQRPVWSMNGSDMLSCLDATYAEIARLETLALHLIAGLETTGHAHELGAGTTARLLTFRYRIDPTKARRDVHLATTLDKYPAVAAALPNPNPLTDDATPDTGASDDDVSDSDVSDSDVSDGEPDAGEDGNGAGLGVLLHPAQAEAIVSALDKVPATVPADDVRVAEREMVELARTHGPLDLRKAGRLIRDRLDTDGPEPDEQKAYDRESLTLKNADHGVAFRGYLANENAELFRTLIHTHAKPHKTLDGALDPRGRDKRQADALTTLLTTTGPTTTAATTTRATTTAAATGATGAAAPTDTATTATATATGANSTTATSTGAGVPTDGAATTDGTPAGTTTSNHPTGSAESTGNAGSRQGPGFTPGHGPKPHIIVTIDFNDLKAATADKLGHLTYGDALSAATIRRLACDAHILPIVLGSDSQPLDVGTTVRLATGPIRKALITRDKGCVCCGAPPIYCDAHHVKSWIDGGETKITNLVLLCKRCHRDLHAGHWTIQIINGIVHVDRPSWATPDPIPHGRYRPPTTTPHPVAATPTTDATTGRTPTTSTTIGGPVARAWPRDTDPPWITPEDAARLNPWGDAPDERPTRTRKLPPGGDFDPWGEGSDDRPPGVPREPADRETVDRDSVDRDSADRESADRESAGNGPAATGVDVWGDPVGPPPNADRRSRPHPDTRGAFDPWGDSAERRDAPTTAA